MCASTRRSRAVLLAEIVLDLRLTHAEHPAELFERHLVVQDHADLIEGETEVAQGQQPMQTAELRDPVRPVPGGRVHSLGLQQTDLVVVTKHPRRNPAEAGEVSDAQHDDIINTPSHSVRVKHNRLARHPLAVLRGHDDLRPVAAEKPGDERPERRRSDS